MSYDAETAEQVPAVKNSASDEWKVSVKGQKAACRFRKESGLLPQWDPHDVWPVAQSLVRGSGYEVARRWTDAEWARRVGESLL